MGLYEGIKDVAKVMQQADNIELYKQLIDLSSQALDMQSEITRLSLENAELKRLKDIESRIERHAETYVTLKDDSSPILYCSRCWDSENKLMQVKLYSNGKFVCPNCNSDDTYDAEKYSNWVRSQRESNKAAIRRTTQW